MLGEGAVLEAGGWDTHVRQGTSNGALYNRLADLGNALAVLPTELGPVWKKTVVVVVTEFGRTVMGNGTGGTDHGTASVHFALGGAVRRGIEGGAPDLDRLDAEGNLTDEATREQVAAQLVALAAWTRRLRGE